MGMDRNTIIGFVLIGALLIAMFIINSQSNQTYLKEKKRIEDSITASKPKPDMALVKLDSLRSDSAIKKKEQLPAVFITDSTGKERFDTLENDVLRIVFTNKGGGNLQMLH